MKEFIQLKHSDLIWKPKKIWKPIHLYIIIMHDYARRDFSELPRCILHLSIIIFWMDKFCIDMFTSIAIIS